MIPKMRYITASGIRLGHGSDARFIGDLPVLPNEPPADRDHCHSLRFSQPALGCAQGWCSGLVLAVGPQKGRSALPA